ncbi:hypothetical protein GQ53DRAFT_823795 [Thozetella sp. PMI_491]|nr:hypothetical protein GQ53DRAFT_823795 [Thozetella sp. PMI_491]
MEAPKIDTKTYNGGSEDIEFEHNERRHVMRFPQFFGARLARRDANQDEIQQLQQSIVTLQRSVDSAIASVRSTADAKAKEASSKSVNAISSARANASAEAIAACPAPMQLPTTTIIDSETVTITMMATLTATLTQALMATAGTSGVDTVTISNSSPESGTAAVAVTALPAQGSSESSNQVCERRILLQ